MPPGPQPGVEQHEIGARTEARREEISDERTRVAIPPVVVLDRGDAGVLLDLHRGQGIGRSPVLASHTRRYHALLTPKRGKGDQRSATRRVSMTRSDEDHA